MSPRRAAFGRRHGPAGPLRRVLIASAAVVALGIAASLGAELYVRLLWFSSFGFGPVYVKLLVAKGLAGLTVGALVGLFFLANLLVFRDILARSFALTPLGLIVSTRSSSYGLLILAVAAGFVAGKIGAAHALDFLRFLEREPFGVSDPIFGRDIGYYVFTFPILRFVYRLFMAATVLASVGFAGAYAAASVRGNRIQLPHRANIHILVLLSLFFVLKAWGYMLDGYALLYSHRGVVFGASYSDIHAQLPALRILVVVSLVCAGVVVANLFVRRTRLTLAGVALLILAWILIGGVYPGIVQRFQVEPNEIKMESPFIETNIRFTRSAYGLDRIVERDFEVSGNLTVSGLRRNELTVRNIRLWDYRPLRQTYRQLQGIRLYYDFPDVDVDRYTIEGKYTQVMLAGREIDMARLPPQARTWVNEHLKYTHGYGICMSPVNEVSEEGLPRFIIKDIPPVSHPDVPVARPGIYFGELTNHHVFLNTRTEEFDYPSGDKNAYSTYTGTGGIPIGSLWRKLIFTWHFRSIKMLLSSDITLESRILFDRNIRTMAQTIAPFLLFDDDPYLVLHEGRIVWIYDAFTHTSLYPYSEPVRGGFNYIRNSVKITIDAYTGEMHFYIFDNSDPIIRAYAKVFPSLFTPQTSMPQSLRAHVRYPQRLFVIQASVYNTYHMGDPQVFYNKEDLWHFPTEIYEESAGIMEPYYIVMKLPDDAEERFVLMMPFTPANKNNMISWMAAHCDGDRYGELVLFKFPKQKLIYGPMQVEARIDQDPDISEQLTLWSQKGSRVIRGNLLVIPIDDDLLYVEPLYIHAEQSQLPELKRIIVSHGGRIAMEETLAAAVEKVFGGAASARAPAKPTPPQPPLGTTATVDELSRLFTEARRKLAAGDWVGFGEAMDHLEKAIAKFERELKESP